MVIAIIWATYYYVFKVPDEGAIEFKKNVEELKKAERGKDRNAPPEVNVRQPEISFLDEGRVVLNIVSEKLETNTGGTVAKFLNSKGTFYRNPDDPEEIFEFDAPVTLYDDSTKSVVISGTITGTLYPEEIHLVADNMKWGEESDLLTAEDVKLKSPNAVVTAGMVKISNRDKILYLTNGVEATINR